MEDGELAILDATAHALKFAGFQDMYFQNSFGPEYEITPDAQLSNVPRLVISQQEKDRLPEDGFTVQAAQNVVQILGLDKRVM